MRVCKGCDVPKPEEEFPLSGGNGTRRNYCKPCYNKKQKAYRDGDGKQAVKSSWRAASKKYQSNPEVQHRRRLRKYKLSEQEYIEMYEAQDGKCKICNESITLVIDHCHASNKVRGLLCNAHNLMIGYAQDDTDVLRKAIEYLEGHEAG